MVVLGVFVATDFDDSKPAVHRDDLVELPKQKRAWIQRDLCYFGVHGIQVKHAMTPVERFIMR